MSESQERMMAVVEPARVDSSSRLREVEQARDRRGDTPARWMTWHAAVYSLSPPPVRLAGAGSPVAGCSGHGDRDLRGVDAAILPGGFSYGDYLRCGAIARFAPVMSELVPAARAGLPVLGICNGFQILCEAHLLPGALTRNAGLKFITRDLRLRVENARTAWTRAYSGGEQIVVPLKSGEGAYAADPGTLADLRGVRPGRHLLRRR